MKTEDIRIAPWGRHEWIGELISADGCPTADFDEEDVADVIKYGTTELTDWDGETAAIVQLKDGRFAAWEADWGPTGDGFCRDAYGGTADIVFGYTESAVSERLSDRGRELLRPVQSVPVLSQ